MAVGIFVWSCVTFISSFMPTYASFIGMRCLSGIGEASYSAIGPAIISDLFRGDTRSKMLALFYFTTPVGGLVTWSMIPASNTGKTILIFF